METKAHYVLIGAFTLAVILAAFAMIYYVSGAVGLAPGKVYSVVFNGSLGGLTNGALVSFNGLKVGEVTNMRIAADNPGRMVVTIKIEATIPVRADTKARLEAQGLGGGATIALIGGAPDAPQLASVNGEPPLLQGEPSQLQTILENVSSLSKRAESTVARIDKLVDDNSDAVSDSIHNLRAFSKALGDNAPALDAALASIGDAAKRIGPLVDRLDKLSEDADRVIGGVDPGKVKDIVDNVADLSAKLSVSAGKIDDLMKSAQGLLGSETTKGSIAEIGEAAKSVHQLADNLNWRVGQMAGGLNRFANQGLREYEGLAVDARRTISDADKLVQMLTKNPSALLFGVK